MYVDDTNLTASRSSIAEIKTILDNDISSCQMVFCKQISLNSIKTEYMLIGSRQKLTSLTNSLMPLIYH